MSGMLLASGNWATSPLWIPLGVFVAIIVGAATVWLTYKLVFSRQRLDYSSFVSPLVARKAELADQLRIFYSSGEKALEEPQFVQVRLTCRSAKDIGRNDFDGLRPLIIEMGVPVVAILSDSGTPTSGLDAKRSGTQIQVGPGLIRKKAMITFDILVDGEPTISVVNPLRDVEMGEHPWEAADPKAVLREHPSLAMTIIILVISNLAFIGLLIFLIVAVNNGG
jgi:hypothetical protein